MSSYDSLGSVNRSSSFKTFTATINGHIIETDNITDMLIKWGNITVTGHLTINDMYDLVNYKLTIGDSIVISLTDLYDDIMLREFIITGTQEKKNQGVKTIQINFRDIISTSLSRIYTDKSYSSTTLDTVLNDYLALGADLDILKYNIKKVINTAPYILENFCVPKNISFLDFLIKECAKQGIYLFQDRKTLVFTPATTAYEVPAHEFYYEQQVNNDLYGFKIMEYNLLFNNVKITDAFPKTNALIYDPSTKSMQVNKYRVEDYQDVMNKSGKVSVQQFTSGELYTTEEYILDNSQYKAALFKKNTVLDIVVPGNNLYNILYSDMNVKLTGNRNSIVTQQNGDVKLSGTYVCFEIQDRIIGSKFIQKLSLYRINEGK